MHFLWAEVTLKVTLRGMYKEKTQLNRNICSLINLCSAGIISACCYKENWTIRLVKPTLNSFKSVKQKLQQTTFNFFLLSFAEQRIHIKHQVLFSLKNNENHLWMSSAAVMIGALRVKAQKQNLCLQISYEHLSRQWRKQLNLQSRSW